VDLGNQNLLLNLFHHQILKNTLINFVLILFCTDKPLSPLSPFGPGSPLSPSLPIGPGIPGEPIAPGSPFSPRNPGKPVGPSLPLSPLGPSKPLSPGGPKTGLPLKLIIIYQRYKLNFVKHTGIHFPVAPG
jgi:hypothetical protein